MTRKAKIQKNDILKIYTDGASRKNPGPAASAFIFVKNNETEPFRTFCKYIGTETNNTAEYLAVYMSLQEAVKYTRWNVEIYTDSELFVRQFNKIYRVKAKHLLEKLNEIYSMTRQFTSVKVFHLPRENKFIEICDKLCNQELDNLSK